MSARWGGTRNDSKPLSWRRDLAEFSAFLLVAVGFFVAITATP